ncbi:MAG: hypothetical protein V9G19_24910 [Tetrasphaera sp.]
MSLDPHNVPYSHGWTDSAAASAIGGTVRVTTTPGTGLTNRWPFSDHTAQRTVALVSARGPQMGVLGIYKDARLVQRIDLRSATAQPRSVVGSVELGYDGRITVANLTPATRKARAITIDEIITIGFDED